MLRARLLTATAAVALFAASSALAQDPRTPTPQSDAETTTGQTMMAPPAPTPAAPVAPQTAPAAAPAPAQTAAAGDTVIDELKANGQFTTLLAALDAAQLTETLKSQPAVSIFAPTDTAFASMPEAERTRLMDPANVNELRQLLLYHVVVADVNSAQIEGTKGGVETAARSQVQLDGTGDAIKVDDATVTTADIDAANGSIFAIDKVLNPANSRVATGDADEAVTEEAPAAATPPAEEPPAAAPPAGDATEAAPPADETETPPPADATDATPPAGESNVPVPPSPSTGSTEVNAPTGQPAAATTTTASPPVVNPTDGQVDGEDSDAPAPAPVPTPTPQS